MVGIILFFYLSMCVLCVAYMYGVYNDSFVIITCAPFEFICFGWGYFVLFLFSFSFNTRPATMSVAEQIYEL